MKRKNTLFVSLLLILLLVVCACSNQVETPVEPEQDVTQPETPTEPSEKPETAIVYPKEMWGTWIRMDANETWKINSTSILVNNKAKENVQMEKTSDKIIKVNDSGRVYCLYASKTASISIKGRMIDMNPSSTRAIEVGGVLGDIVAQIENKNDCNDVTSFETNSNGEFQVDGLIPGQEYEVKVEDRSPITIVPNWNGEDIGTISYCDGINFKVAINRGYSNSAYYSNGSNAYTCSLNITNKGSEDCLAATFSIDPEPGLHCKVVGDYAGHPILGTIEAGATKVVELEIRSDMIQEESIFRKLNITVRDDINKREWKDSVSFKFYKEPIKFNIVSTGPISGVVQEQDSTYSFYDRKSIDIVLPKLDTDYLCILSGATASTEATYSIGIDRASYSSLDSFDTPGDFEPNDTEQEAATLPYESPIIAYLHKNDIDYYEFNPSTIEDKIYHVGYEGPAGGIIIYDKGDDSDGWRYLEVYPSELRLIDNKPSIDTLNPLYAEGKYRFVLGGGKCPNYYAFPKRTCLGMAGTYRWVENYRGYESGQYAASLCNQLISINKGMVFDDWFLPDLDEVYSDKKSLIPVNLFDAREAWCSSIRGNYNVYVCNMLDDWKHFDDLLKAYPVRAFSTKAVSWVHINLSSDNKVVLSCNTPGVTMYYQIGSGEVMEYANPFTVPSDTIVWAWAKKAGFETSVSNFEYITY